LQADFVLSLPVLIINIFILAEHWLPWIGQQRGAATDQDVAEACLMPSSCAFKAKTLCSLKDVCFVLPFKI